MNTATIDFPCRLAGVQTFALQGDPDGAARPLVAAGVRALDDVDLVIWNAAPLLAGPFERFEADGRGVLSPEQSLQRLVQSRALRAALDRFLRRAGTLAVLLPAAGSVGVHTLQEVVGFEPLESLPDRSPQLAALPAAASSEPPAGASLDWRSIAGEPFSAFFAAAAPWLQPLAALDGEALRPIAVLAAQPDVIVAGYRYVRPGRLLWLPAARPALAPAKADALVDAVRSLALRLGVDDRVARPPAWWLAAPPVDESELADRVAALVRHRLDTEDALERSTRELADLRRVSALAWGDREAVLRALADAMSRFGAYVQPIGADHEVVVEHDGRVGVIVVVAALPTEPAVALAVAAAARIGADLGVPVRPILMSVAEHGTPLSERPAPDPQRAAAAARAGVAVLDGAALLTAWRAADPALLVALLRR